MIAMVMATLVTMATIMSMLLLAMVVLVAAERPAEPRVGGGVRWGLGLLGVFRARPGPVKSPPCSARRPTEMARPLVSEGTSAGECSR